MKVSVAYSESSDAQIREELAGQLRELSECYGRAAEAAMARQDRHTVYECVKREREAHARAHRIEKGYVRF